MTKLWSQAYKKNCVTLVASEVVQQCSSSGQSRKHYSGRTAGQGVLGFTFLLAAASGEASLAGFPGSSLIQADGQVSGAGGGTAPHGYQVQEQGQEQEQGQDN